MPCMEETKFHIILRGTTLLDVEFTPTRLRRINAYLCNGRARSNLLWG